MSHYLLLGNCPSRMMQREGCGQGQRPASAPPHLHHLWGWACSPFLPFVTGLGLPPLPPYCCCGAGLGPEPLSPTHCHSEARLTPHHCCGAWPSTPPPAAASGSGQAGPSGPPHPPHHCCGIGLGLMHPPPPCPLQFWAWACPRILSAAITGLGHIGPDQVGLGWAQHDLSQPYLPPPPSPPLF